MVADFAYALELPSSEELRTRMSQLVEFWRPRNQMIERINQTIEGKNPIEAPSTAQYKVRVAHSYHLLKAMNEKQARFMRQPAIAVLPNGSGMKARAEATKLQEAINKAFEVMELQSDGNVWSRVVRDAIMFDAGVERIERAPAAFWPDLVVGEDGKDKLVRIFEDPDEYSKAKEEYKKRAGLPLRTVHVPLAAFFPVYEGPKPVETFEIERRSLREVLSNKLFDTSMLRRYDGAGDMGIKSKISILMYSNQQYFAYYAMAPVAQRDTRWPDQARPDLQSIGQPILLHAYKHGLGRVPYNIVGGRYGGWKSGSNAIEAVTEALLEMNQTADNIHSIALTNIRHLGWPTYVAYYDRDTRGADEGMPKAPVIQEGQNIAMYSTERLENLAKPVDFNLIQWYMSQLREGIGELSGSSSVFGVHQPGVATGYHENLQITMAEHLDNQIELNLAQGAIQRVHLMFRHVTAMGEKVYVRTPAVDKKGNKYADYVALDPAKIDVQDLELSAKVKADRPMDFMANMQAALQATQIRPGHNTPLIDDETALSKLLGFESPDEIQTKVVEQGAWERLLQSGRIDQEIMQRLNLLLVQQSAPDVNEQQVANASPAFQTAFQTLNQNGEAAAMGGTNPKLLGQMIDNHQGVPSDTGAGGPLNGVGGGIPPGQPQPMQQMGRANALMSGTRI